MAKVVLFNMVSADGFFQHKDQGLSLKPVNEEITDFFIQELEAADALFFGRRTFELARNYWLTTQDARAKSRLVQLMNGKKKFVCSNTLTDAQWENTTIISAEIKQEVIEIKKRMQKNVLVLGSREIANILLRERLIDEIKFMIYPEIVSEGRRLFHTGSLHLQLLKVRVFGNGNILCNYIPLYDLPIYHNNKSKT